MEPAKGSSFIDGVECYVTPNKVWKYFTENLYKLKENIVEIAHNSTNSTSVFITEEDENLRMYVDVLGDTVCEALCMTGSDAEETLRDIYSEYILVTHPKHVGISKYDMIEDRENELRDAFMQFLEIVVDDSGILYLPSYEEDVQRMLDYIIEYIAVDNEISVFRPMLVENDGVEEYVEYPYEEVSIPTEE